MQTSPEIDKLAAALAAAQSEIEGAKKDGTNPHFRSSYTTLASIWDACREALTKNGIAVTQSPYLAGIDDSGATVGVVTRLVHSSGQWLEGDLVLPVSKADAQGFGSAITYARRYSLAAMVGVCPEDDDAESAVGDRSAAPSRSAYPKSRPQIVSGKRELTEVETLRLQVQDKIRQLQAATLIEPGVLGKDPENSIAFEVLRSDLMETPASEFEKDSPKCWRDFLSALEKFQADNVPQEPPPPDRTEKPNAEEGP